MALPTCKQFIEALDDYLDGRQEPERRREFETHLRSCSACTDYLRTYQQTVRLGRAALSRTDDALPPDVPEGLVRAVMSMVRKES